MLKLNAGLSRKIGEPDYGSRGACVNLELEVESQLAADPEALHEKIRRLFVLARAAVDEELNGGRTPSKSPVVNGVNGANGNGSATQSAPPNRSNGRPATASQLRAIRSICDQLQLDPEIICREKANAALESLSLREASALIDELKAQTNGKSVPARTR